MCLKLLQEREREREREREEKIGDGMDPTKL